MKINCTIIEWLKGIGVPIYETAAGVEEDEDGNIIYPYLVVSDTKIYEGSDERNMYIRHSLYLYYYTESGTDNRVEKWLNRQNIKFSCDKTYLEEDDAYEIEYAINEDIITKIQEDKDVCE